MRLPARLGSCCALCALGKLGTLLSAPLRLDCTLLLSIIPVHHFKSRAAPILLATFGSRLRCFQTWLGLGERRSLGKHFYGLPPEPGLKSAVELLAQGPLIFAECLRGDRLLEFRCLQAHLLSCLLHRAAQKCHCLQAKTA